MKVNLYGNVTLVKTFSWLSLKLLTPLLILTQLLKMVNCMTMAGS